MNQVLNAIMACTTFVFNLCRFYLIALLLGWLTLATELNKNAQFDVIHAQVCMA